MSDTHRSHPPPLLASIVVVLLWLWLSSLVVLIGSEVDGLRAEQARLDP